MANMELARFWQALPVLVKLTVTIGSNPIKANPSKGGGAKPWV